MWIWSYAVRIYYALKYYYDAYFKSRNDLLNKPVSDKDPKITKLECEIKELYDTIDIKYIFNCLRVLNKDYNEHSRLTDIVNFLEEEAQFILQNKDNLEISLNKIKENTYVLELISKFKLLDEIREKEIKLNKLKHNRK
jgi:hypothetical protein